MSTSPDAVPPAQSSTRQRIVDAALAVFGDGGVGGTPLKAVAARAGVSPGLIIHHFGSKDGLREACDRHAAAVIREGKYVSMEGGLQIDPLENLRRIPTYQPVLRYLARTLGDGRPEVTKIVDEMIDDAVGYLAEGERSGLITPSAWPRERAAILVLWSLGMMTLHEHVARHLGVDLLGVDDPAQLKRYFLPTVDLLSQGVLSSAAYELITDAFERLEQHDPDETGAT